MEVHNVYRDTERGRQIKEREENQSMRKWYLKFFVFLDGDKKENERVRPRPCSNGLITTCVCIHVSMYLSIYIHIYTH